MTVPSSKRRLPRLQLRVASGRCFSQNVRPLQDGLFQHWNVGIDRPEATDCGIPRGHMQSQCPNSRTGPAVGYTALSELQNYANSPDLRLCHLPIPFVKSPIWCW